ncbi:protein FAM166A-like [Cyanistes caeruleus]|uniref:protein FAM166A-like n=1 Tax=Cyanistes caeruleus TaxID=156563 RepID=UPI000CDA3F5F|nr:protein FAM166A-like [Cyanistes caeruleus]
MAAYKGNNIFPKNPYYIPGYGGYVPQFPFKFGNTYGRITHDVLTDPTISKSPRSLLAPLDNQANLHKFHYHIDHPGYVTYQPITNPPEIPLGPQPVPRPLEEPMMTHMDPRNWQCPPEQGESRTWLPLEPQQGLALHPAAQEMEMEVAKPPLASALGRLGVHQCNCGGSKTVSGGLGMVG